MQKVTFWICARCQETLEPQFKVCWKCGTSYEGQVDPNFPIGEKIETESAGGRLSTMLIGIGWFVLWIAFCIGLILAAWITDYYLPNALADNMAAILFLFVAGLLLGVTINVSGQLYWILRQHFWPEEDAANLVPLHGNQPPITEPSENQT